MKMGFLRWLWRLSGSVWDYSATDGRWARASGTLWTFVFLLFVLFFAVAWIFGYPPADVTGWLDAHAWLWKAIGNLLWRGFWVIVLLFCAAILVAIGLEWFGQKAAGEEDTPRDFKGGFCALIAVAVASYVAWVAITMDG